MKNIWVPVSGQIAQQRKIETIANNVANANTTGFKKDDVTFKEYLTALDKGLEDIDVPRRDWSAADFYKTNGAQNSFVVHDGTYTNHDQGQLQFTREPLDFGLDGKGFIEVLTPNGIRYTRNGNLSLNDKGQLSTKHGYLVLSPKTEVTAQEAQPEDPRSRTITIGNSVKNISVDESGKIFNQDQEIGQFSIVEFKDLNALKKEGPFYINNAVENINRQAANTKIRQGFLEGSNVNTVQEMSELIKAHRHFENIQKAIQSYDNIMGKAVNDISKF